MPLVTIKMKAKRRPPWGYVVTAIASLLAVAFQAWLAYAAIGFSPVLARQVFIVLGGLSLLFCPLFYLANERQVRDPSSKALIITAVAFVALLSAAVVYFIAKHEGEMILTFVFGFIVIGLGIYISLFVVRYEFE